MPESKSENSSWTIESKRAYDAKNAGKKLTPKSKAVLWILAGFLILGFTAPQDIHYLVDAPGYQTTEGTITATDYGRRGKCTVTLDFVVNGTKYTTDQRSSYKSCDDTIGKHMWLRYHPKDIQGTVTDNHENGSLFIAWARLSSGVMALIIGSILFRKSIKLSKASKEKS